MAGALANGVASEQAGKPKDLYRTSSAVRSSFTGLRPGSASGPKASPSGRRDSSTGFVGSLLHGIASAVGLHRNPSPSRDRDGSTCSPDVSVGRRASICGAGGQGHALARLSSAALMRSELQNLNQFGDLRNDSFSTPSCARLRRRSSTLLPRASDASISAPVHCPVPSGILTPGTSGDLSRRSTGALTGTAAAAARLTCPGEMSSPVGSPIASAEAVAATAAALATPPPREAGSAVPSASPFNSAATAAVTAAASSPRVATATAAAAAGPPLAGGGGGLRARRRSSSGGAPGALMVEIPPMVSPPSTAAYQTRPSGSSLSPAASRSVSNDHLPPMTPGSAGSGGGGGGLLSVRDRPPTPRGAHGAAKGSEDTSTLARVLSSFHLPDILVPGAGSGKSVTERRSSVAGGSGPSFSRPADVGMPRSRRNSISSGPSITGPPSTTGGGPTGPGGAAICASLAKRAAVAAGGAAAAAAPPSPSLAVVTSGSSWSSLPRPSPSSGGVAGRTSSVTCGRPPGLSSSGGILQDFQNSLEIDEEGGALAAVDAEFDRRFGQPAPDVPGAIDGGGGSQPSQLPSPAHPHPPPHLQPLNHPNHPHPQPPLTPSPPPPAQTQPPQLTPRQQHPPQPQPPPQPHAPPTERTAPQNNARRVFAMGDGSARTSGGGVGVTATAALGAGGPPVCRAPRRMSCSETMTFDSSGDDIGSDQVLLSSVDALPPYDGRSSHRMRLASIRLSYAEGIIGGGAAMSASGASGAAAVVGARASLDLSPGGVGPLRHTPAAWAAGPAASSPQPPPLLVHRPVAPALATGPAMSAASRPGL